MYQNEKNIKERMYNMPQEKTIMLKLAELLSQYNLISPDEQARLVQKINMGEES